MRLLDATLREQAAALAGGEADPAQLLDATLGRLQNFEAQSAFFRAPHTVQPAALLTTAADLRCVGKIDGDILKINRSERMHNMYQSLKNKPSQGEAAPAPGARAFRVRVP